MLRHTVGLTVAGGPIVCVCALPLISVHQHTSIYHPMQKPSHKRFCIPRHPFTLRRHVPRSQRPIHRSGSPVEHFQKTKDAILTSRPRSRTAAWSQPWYDASESGLSFQHVQGFIQSSPVRVSHCFVGRSSLLDHTGFTTGQLFWKYRYRVFGACMAIHTSSTRRGPGHS